MSSHSCSSCSMRARYESNPRSFLGRLWRWHSKWCPGWKSYMKTLSEEERADLKAHLESLDSARK